LGRSPTAPDTIGSLANEARLRPLRSIAGREHCGRQSAEPVPRRPR